MRLLLHDFLLSGPVSSQSQASLFNLSGLVLRLRSAPNQENAARTFCSRQAHWLEFVLKHELPNAVLSSLNNRDKKIVLAVYTADLANNNTILFRSIKSGTIKQYLRAAASFSVATQFLTPQLEIYGKWYFWIKKVLQEVR